MQINFVVFNSSGGGNRNLYLLHEEAKKEKLNQITLHYQIRNLKINHIFQN